MKYRFLRCISTAIIILGLSFLFEKQAYGYADPGSGLMAIQIIGATLSSAGFYFRHKLLKIFPSRKRKAAEQQNLEATSTTTSKQNDSVGE